MSERERSRLADLWGTPGWPRAVAAAVDDLRDTDRRLLRERRRREA